LTDLEKIEGFQWDKGNQDKNWRSHKVSDLEIEQIFFNQPLVTGDDEKHSKDEEKRFYTLGKTDGNRLLFAVFTIRKNLISIISARDMSSKERKIYNENQKKGS
jgi:uncharacterized protein